VVSCIGVFQVASDFPKDSAEKYVLIVGAGMLYASVREMVSIVTARGPFPTIWLVAQNFTHGYEKAKQAQKDAPK
jgi:preprotein translocase subunit SecB